MNLIGRLQLSTEKARKEENESIMQLRILRTQEAIIKILKMRKVSNFKGLIRKSLSIHMSVRPSVFSVRPDMSRPPKKSILQ